MGELIQVWDDAENADVFPPNCQNCLTPMEPGGDGWVCATCGLSLPLRALLSGYTAPASGLS